MSDFNRLCVLSFTEISMLEAWSYEKTTDTVYASMIRALTINWRQLVYCSFDTDMSKYILFDLVVKLEDAGMVIVAIANDLFSANVEL